MKIYHIISSLGNGGAEKNLIRLSLSQSKTNDIVIIILKKNNFFREILKRNKIRVITFDFNFNKSLLNNLIGFFSTLKKEKPDMIFSWMFHACFLSSIFAWKQKTRLFWCMRHGSFEVMKTKFLTLIIAKYILPMISFIPSKIIYNSQFSKNYYEKIRYNKKKSLVIHNGYSQNHFKPNKKKQIQFKKKYNIKKNDIIFGYVARFNPQKNHILLLKVMNKLKYDYKLNFKLILIGGNIRNNKILKNLLKEFYLINETIILKETNEINLVYPIFDINLLCSAYGESFPNTLAESMLCQVPCISSNVGDSKEIVKNKRYIFEKNNENEFLKSIVRILKDRSNDLKWKTIKVNCRIHINKCFNIKKMILMYDNALNKKY